MKVPRSTLRFVQVHHARIHSIITLPTRNPLPTTQRMMHFTIVQFSESDASRVQSVTAIPLSPPIYHDVLVLVADREALVTARENGLGACSHLKAPSTPPLMSSPPYVEHIRNIDKATNKVTNSPARKRARHPVSPSYSSTTLPPPPFPSLPGTSIAIKHRADGK